MDQKGSLKGASEGLSHVISPGWRSGPRRRTAPSEWRWVCVWQRWRSSWTCPCRRARWPDSPPPWTPAHSASDSGRRRRWPGGARSRTAPPSSSAAPPAGARCATPLKRESKERRNCQTEEKDFHTLQELHYCCQKKTQFTLHHISKQMLNTPHEDVMWSGNTQIKNVSLFGTKMNSNTKWTEDLIVSFIFLSLELDYIFVQ